MKIWLKFRIYIPDVKIYYNIFFQQIPCLADLSEKGTILKKISVFTVQLKLISIRSNCTHKYKSSKKYYVPFVLVTIIILHISWSYSSFLFFFSFFRFFFVFFCLEIKLRFVFIFFSQLLLLNLRFFFVHKIYSRPWF